MKSREKGKRVAGITVLCDPDFRMRICHLSADINGYDI